MELYAILSDCTNKNNAGRKAIEAIEGQVFDNIESVIKKCDGDIMYMPMYEFTTLFNDDENAASSKFFSYVFIKTKDGTL